MQEISICDRAQYILHKKIDGCLRLTLSHERFAQLSASPRCVPVPYVAFQSFCPCQRHRGPSGLDVPANPLPYPTNTSICEPNPRLADGGTHDTWNPYPKPCSLKSAKIAEICSPAFGPWRGPPEPWYTGQGLDHRPGRAGLVFCQPRLARRLETCLAPRRNGGARKVTLPTKKTIAHLVGCGRNDDLCPGHRAKDSKIQKPGKAGDRFGRPNPNPERQRNIW